MRAGDLAAPFPTVSLATPAIEAAALLALQNLPGLIVVDDEGRPLTILQGTQALRMAVPQYCEDEPVLARMIDEAAADAFLREPPERTVAAVLPRERRELPVVEPDATVLEVAALMARVRSPVVAVADRGGTLRGAITLDMLLQRMLAS
jgi:CBS domain-containing protein